MTDLSQLTLEALYTRLDELNAQWQAVEKAIEEKQLEDKRQLAQEIKAKIEAAGHDVGDIAGLLASRQRRAVKTTRSYARYVDPDNTSNSYSRGVLPGWLKEGMAAKGLDPSSKEDRESYKQKYLKKVSG